MDTNVNGPLGNPVDINNKPIDQTENVENKKIKSGFDQGNSLSDNVNIGDKPNKSPHRIDPPTVDGTTPSEKVLKDIATLKEIQKLLKQGKFGDLIPDKTLFNGSKNPLARHIASLKNNRQNLIDQGFSAKLVDKLIQLADPDSKNNPLADMHSVSARIANPSLAKLYHVFSDVLNHVSSLETAPVDIQKKLQGKLENMINVFLGASKESLDVDSAIMMLMSIQTDLQDRRLKFNQENIKLNQIAKQQASDERLEKLTDSVNKLKEAKKSGVVGTIFGGIAVAAMAIVSAVMVLGAVFTGGASAVAAAALMVGATTLVMIMTASNHSGNWMLEIFGSDRDQILGAMIFWTVLITVMTLGSSAVAGAGGSAGAAVNATAQGATTGAAGAGGASVSATAANAATTTAKVARITEIADKMSRAFKIIGGLSMVADGSASIAQTKYTYDAEMLKAEAKKLYAWILYNQQMTEDLAEDIQRVVEELAAGFDTIFAILKDNNDTKSYLIKNIRM